MKRLTLKRKQEQAATAESGAPASKQKKVIIQVSFLIVGCEIRFVKYTLGVFYFVFTVVAYLFYHEKAIKALQRARLGVAHHLYTTPRWGNPVKCSSQWHNK